MKMIFILLFCMVMQLQGFAVTDAEDAAHWTEANESYRNGDYSAAIRHYEAISAYEKRADVLFNIGNAYHKTGQLGKAILSFERAHVLDPGNRSIVHNLELAGQQVQNPYSDNRFVLSKWWEQIAGVLTPDGWSILFFIAVAATVWLFSRIKRLRKKNNVLLAFITAATLMVGMLMIQSVNNLGTAGYGIAVKTAAQYFSDESRTNPVERMIPEGTKVKVLSRTDETVGVQLPNGIIAYLEVDYIQNI